MKSKRARASLIEEIFDRVADMEPDEQVGYLDERCAGDPTLRQRVEELLRADCYTGSDFLDNPLEDVRAVHVDISPIEPATVVGSYRIAGELGRGGMGVVYEANHVSLDKRAVIKMLHPEFTRQPEVVERFMNEANALAKCQHPGIVDVYDIGVHTDNQMYIVLELLNGETLERRLRRVHKLTPQTALSLSCQVARTLAFVHQRSIIHRDLKPENLIIVRDPEVRGGHRIKILDFGIAKLAADHGGGGTKSGMVMGTPAYMSPEQCRGSRDVDHRTDLYALGVILFRMLSGRLPFVKHSPIEYFDAHRHERAPDLSGCAPHVAPDLVKLVARLLGKSPDERFPSADALVVALDAMQSQASESGDDTVSKRATREESRGSPRREPAVSGDGFTEPKTGIQMLHIPGGVVAEQDSGDPSRTGAGRLTRVAPFFLSQTPVTNEQYLRFVHATGYAMPALAHDARYSGDAQPVVGVAWHDAKAYCEWLNVSPEWIFDLPSDAQWFFAARGADDRRYPWGNAPATPEHATYGGDLHADAPRPVGSCQAGRGAYGVLEQAGNVWEWCEDEWTFGDVPAGVPRMPALEPLSLRVIRGGSYASTEEELRVSARRFHVAESGVRFVGIRIVATPGAVLKT